MLKQRGNLGDGRLLLRLETERLVSGRLCQRIAGTVGAGDVGRIIKLDERYNLQGLAIAHDEIRNLAVEAGTH